MNSIAVKIAPSDDPWVPRSTKSLRYAPPPRSETVMVSKALKDTCRLAASQQLTFLKDKNPRTDIPIYYVGDLSLLNRPCVSVVGTRNVSESGIRTTKWLTRKLTAAGIVIVSGLAYGVDTVAHTTAIESGGKTIAVIGTPLDKASPSENARLQESIYRNHLLISQFKEGEKTFPAHFPLRNRLMAALSDATVVMEARDGSGTLHQAAECTKLERWLFIAKAVVDDPDVSWPRDFLRYETCVVFDKASQIIDRVLKSYQSSHTERI